MLEAENLAQMDHFLGIQGKSDPYAKVSIGLQHFRSKTIYKNLNPTWNEVFEVRVSLATLGYSWCPPGPTLGCAGYRQGRALPFMGLTYLWGNTEPREWASGTGKRVCIIPTSHIYHVSRSGLL